MEKGKYIQTSDAPAAIGPYSQAVEVNGMLFISGQIPIDPHTGNVIEADIKQQTRQVIKNIEAILIAAGYPLTSVVKTTCYLTDMNSFTDMNAVYAEYFTGSAPARATVEVSRLPKDVLIEIDAIAIK